jgi:RES domain-containing protein
VIDERELLGGSVDPRVARVRWQRAVRIIPSRFPPVDLYERVAPPEDFAALHAVESLTNARLRDAEGVARLVPPEDAVRSPGSSWIMAPFTHLHPAGGRFNDGTFGALYAARERPTAVTETCYHRARFLAATREPPINLDMRVLELRIDARLHDLRGLRAALPAIYDPDCYDASQRLGRRLRAARSWGIAFDSVRHAAGACVALFRPRAVSSCRQAEHLEYVWDGTRIAAVLEKRRYPPAGGPPPLG